MLLVSIVRCDFIVLRHLILCFRIHLIFLLNHLNINLICFSLIVLRVIHIVLMSSHTLHGIPLYLFVLLLRSHILSLSSKFGVHVLGIRLLHFLSFVVD